ncbi:uncharacterized protein LOC108903068 isoform X2 [Lates japonicus]
MKAAIVCLFLGVAVLQLFEVTVSAGASVTLELPELPVFAGSDVTLRCKTGRSSKQTAYFFRNGTYLGYRLNGEFIINNIQPSHEGFYSCSTGLFSASFKSWLSVRDPPPSSPSPPLPLAMLFCHLVVICLYCIPTALMVSIYCSRRRGKRDSHLHEDEPPC